MRVLYPGRVKIWSFYGGRKPENPEKNPRSKDENQQQTQPTYDTGPGLNLGHIGGRRALSPLRHPCSPFGTLIAMGVVTDIFAIIKIIAYER